MLRPPSKTPPGAVRNVYCNESADLVIPWSCAVCSKCWRYVAGRKTGICPWAGPFTGFDTDHADAPTKNTPAA